MPTQPTKRDFGSPELNILCCCARTQPDETTVERLHALLQKPVDWPHLIALAQYHRLSPLLFTILSRHAADLVPPQTLTTLRQEFYGNGWLNHHLSREVAEVVKLLEAHDIRVVPFKGVSLAVDVYGQLSLRQAGDIDILVSPADAIRAKRVMVEVGGFSSPDMNPAEEALFFQNGLHFDLARPDLRTSVELHWNLMAPYFPEKTDFEAIWTRCRRITLADTRVATFGPADLLRYLCLHGSGHMWPIIRWVTDVAELIDRHGVEIDWDTVVAQTKTDPSRRMVWLGLYLAQDLLGVELPEPVQVMVMADDRLPALARQVYRRFLISNYTTPEADLERFFFELSLLTQLSDRLRFVRFTVAPHNTNRKDFSLPVSLSFLYYLIRPAQFASKFVRSRMARISTTISPSIT
ncbi:MAG: nucleotidyltransferase family protein [Anaerolineae bacterium]|nr:nucleotidyltransferase family protein [Anaerolineae bacterium]